MILTEENIREEFEKSLKSFNECVDFCKKQKIKFVISDEDSDPLYSDSYPYGLYLSELYKLKQL